MAKALSQRAGFRQARAGALAFVLAVGLSASAAPPDETEPIRLEYTAPSGCPDANEFGRRVFGRTSKARAAEEAEAARTFVVLIETSGAETQGSLVVREDGMSTLARRVSGKNCDEVSRALALATALAIDPEAAIETPEPIPSDAGTAGAGATSSAPDATQETPKPPIDTPPPDKTPTTAESERIALLFGPSAAFGLAPNPTFGASVGLEWNSPIARSSAFGGEFVFLTGAKNEVAGAKSSFVFAFARPYACPVGVPLGTNVGLLPCVAVALGAVVASGSELENPEKETRFWATGELALRLDIAFSEDWFMDLAGGAIFPFTRYQFVFRTPETAIYDIPAVAAGVGLRVGRRF
jgi:hypothetical protein